MPDPVDLSLVEAAEAVRTGRLDVVELTEACLARAEATSSLGAFALLDHEGARRQAAALAGAGARGPLHGVPVAVKDVIDVEGLPTRGGSAVLDGDPAARDAPLVARLREAGAVVVGKTATHELAFGVTTPAAANPWDPDRSPGGSSGGSAVAVATGAAFASLGTDTAGSIRLPAAFCGVSGLKARHGALPMEGILPLAPSMDSAGAFARSAEDLAVVWSVLSGAPPAGDLGGLRLGVPAPPADADDEIAAAVTEAVALLADEGAVTVTVPAWTAWERPRGRTLVAEALDVHRAAGWYPARRERYGAEPLAYLESAERLSDAERATARQELADLAWLLRAALAGVDVLALPTCAVAAPARDADPRRAARELTPLCGPANAAGLAAASVPCGFTAGGLPIGLQLVGESEAAVLAVASRHQSLSSVHERRPLAGGVR